jgi:hypothetical protein
MDDKFVDSRFGGMEGGRKNPPQSDKQRQRLNSLKFHPRQFKTQVQR